MCSSRISVNNYYREKRRYCLFRLEDDDINIVIAHLNSDRISQGKESRWADISEIISNISRMEEKFQSKQTLVIGDLNIGLFDDQMLLLTGFNAKLFKYQLSKESRKIHEEERDMFYNPMLAVYKDQESEEEARGTHFYAGAHPHWHCYDHVLMKPTVIPRFNIHKLRIINRLGQTKLVEHNKTVETISDHLPVYFEIDRRV